MGKLSLEGRNFRRIFPTKERSGGGATRVNPGGRSVRLWGCAPLRGERPAPTRKLPPNGWFQIFVQFDLIVWVVDWVFRKYFRGKFWDFILIYIFCFEKRFGGEWEKRNCGFYKNGNSWFSNIIFNIVQKLIV